MLIDIGKFWHFILQATRSLIKYITHYYTSTCEIGRICSAANGCHSSKMTVDFAKSLRQSKQISTYNKIVFHFKPFSVTSALDNIINIKFSKTRPHPIVMANISHCLQSLRGVNVIHSRLELLRKESFNPGSSNHVEVLDRLWCNMRPNIRRVGGLVTSEWGEIGFQGKDPSTDFRGMGMLGLHQLVYFSQHRHAEAMVVLRESNHQRRYFPYAATGISMTKFVLELLSETRLHSLLAKRLDRDALSELGDNVVNESSAADEHVAVCCDAVHEVYCDVYHDFCALWVQRDPRDIMSFSALFAELQATYRGLYPPL